MELTEPIDTLNQRLKDNFGVDTITGLPMYRIVFSEDQYENRYGTYDDITPAGVYLRTVTEVRKVPKYKQWIHAKYVLERLTIIPQVSAEDLPDSQLSYEPLWVFEDRNGNYLPPKWEAAEFCVQAVIAAMHNTGGLAKYIDEEEGSQEAALESKKRRIATLENELFGDETGLLGTTISGESIIVPNNYERKN
jgi:hypothetical protein